MSARRHHAPRKLPVLVAIACLVILGYVVVVGLVIGGSL